MPGQLTDRARRMVDQRARPRVRRTVRDPQRRRRRTRDDRAPRHDVVRERGRARRVRGARAPPRQAQHEGREEDPDAGDQVHDRRHPDRDAARQQRAARDPRGAGARVVPHPPPARSGHRAQARARHRAARCRSRSIPSAGPISASPRRVPARGSHGSGSCARCARNRARPSAGAPGRAPPPSTGSTSARSPRTGKRGWPDASVQLLRAPVPHDPSCHSPPVRVVPARSASCSWC